jgi:dUTP pyrophosphatase
MELNTLLKHTVQLKVLDERVWNSNFIPLYETLGSAGMDLHANIDSDMILNPGEVKLIPTGIAMSIDNNSICATILPRSGLGHNVGLVLGNLVGLIDSDYQGEIKISAWNRSSDPITISKGQRIAQLVFLPVINVDFDFVESFKSNTVRGSGGFGSTGQ